MLITKVCNLVGTDEFKSKDGTKVFHHATFLADDTTIKVQFITQNNYTFLSLIPRLSEVECDFNVAQTGTDQLGNAAYGFRLAEVREFQTEKKPPFKSK